MSNTQIFNALLQTLAPTRLRRKRARLEKPTVVPTDFLAVHLAQTPNATPQTLAQLQAAYNARCADEMRSSF